ncbi:MAG: sulfite exporter TauE/SafE family protein [Clostridiales bacterium]|nr:sulfite exporter TauE/SafE family protein [Clostridiales bacterium]
MGLWIAATLCAFFVKGLCGFANTLVFTGILSFANANVSISPVELLVVYPSNFIVAWSERKSVQWNYCGPLALLVLAGNIPGVLLLKNADSQAIKLLFGVVITVLGIEMLLREQQREQRQQSRLVLAVIGVLSGLLCGLYGVGALLAAYVSRVTSDSRAFKGTICVVFIVESTFRLAAYTWLGIITAQVVRQALLPYPVMLVGLFLGMKSSQRLDETLARRLVTVALILFGVALMIENLPF